MDCEKDKNKGSVNKKGWFPDPCAVYLGFLSLLKKEWPLLLGCLIFIFVFGLGIFEWYHYAIFISILIVGRIVIPGWHKFNMAFQTFFIILTLSINAIQLSQQIKLSKDQKQLTEEQLKQFGLDREKAELEKRPYLFVDFGQYILAKREKDDDILFGAEMIFKNTGLIPAKIITAESGYSVCDENKCGDYKGWYSGTYGGFPDPQLISPGGKLILPYAAGINKNTQCACIGTLISYRGINSEKTYWYYRKAKFCIKQEKDAAGNITGISAHPIKDDIEWDENTTNKRPLFKETDPCGACK